MRLSSVSRSSLLVATLAFSVRALGQQPAAGRQLTPADLKAWKTIRQSTLSNDGRWFAYVAAPNEGEASVTIRETADQGKSYTFNIGAAPAGAGRPGGRGGAAGTTNATFAFAGDSKWAAFIINPPQAASGGRGRGGRGGGPAAAASAPAQDRLGLLNLATGEKREFDRVRRFAFNGDQPTWLAMQNFPPSTPAPTASTGAPADQGDRATGTDLVLYKLATSELINVGNVGEFAFDDSGSWLAYTIDARDEIGNGVQIRNMNTDVVRVADNDRALYRHVVWRTASRRWRCCAGVPTA